MLLLLVFLVACAAAQEAELDAFIAEVMRCADIPGLALAVVRDGQTWLLKGYGVEDIITEEPVTPDSLFAIGSTSKAFTGVALAILLKNTEGVDFQTPVHDVLGDWFYLHDGTRTAQVNLRDVIAHRTGLPGNSEMRMADWNLTEFVHGLQYLEYTYDFRDRYRYNSAMYGIATLMAETLDGRSFTDMVEDEIFTPIGMDSSTFVTLRSSWPDFVTGYREDGSELRLVSLEVSEAYLRLTPGSAGVGSTARDMSRWIKFQLNRGTTEDGTEILTSEEFAETHRALIQRTSSPDFQRPDDPVTFAPPSRYSLGWEETTYRDYEMYRHTGSTGGFHSMVAVLPDVDHGVFIGINKSPDIYARDVITMYILDVLLGIEPWLNVDNVCDVMNSKYATFQQRKQQQWQHQTNKKGAMETSPVAMVDEYVGVYGNFAYGNVTLRLGNDPDSLVFTYGWGNYTWDITQDAQDPDFFSGFGREPFWYYNIEMQFERESGEPAHAVTVLSFDDEIPPRFERDLDFDNPPTPPEPCV